MKKKILKGLLSLVALTSVTTGCSKTTLTSVVNSIEYSKDTVDTSTLVEESGYIGNPEKIDASEVGEYTVKYFKNGKNVGSLLFTVEDTKIPVLTIDDKLLTVKTKGTVNSEIKSTDKVDGELKKIDKIPTSTETVSSKIGVVDFYDEGWYVVDTSKVDTTKAGEYDAKVTSADKHGNTVIVNYKVTVSYDGIKSNNETTIEIKTVNEQEYTIENVTTDKIETTLSEINTNTIEKYAEEHEDQVTAKGDVKVEDVTKKEVESTATPSATTSSEIKKEETSKKIDTSTSSKKSTSTNSPTSNSTANKTNTSSTTQNNSSSASEKTSTSTSTHNHT